MIKIRSLALVALGANLPCGEQPPRETVSLAIDSLTQKGLTLRGVSRFYSTPCFPPGAGPDYVNAAIAADWGGSAQDLLNLLHDVEDRFGRVRAQRWGMRTLDLDLIALDDTVLPSPQVQKTWRHLPASQQIRAVPDCLILPHPRVQDRAFVLGPLRDIAPNWRHPLTGATLAQMAAALPDGAMDALTPL